MSIAGNLDELGDAFRGLWKSYMLDGNNLPNIKKWTVTFIFQGHYIETPEFNFPQDALAWAIAKMKQSY